MKSTGKMDHGEIEYLLLDAGLEVQKFNDGIHWRLYGENGFRWDWYPSTGTFTLVGSRKKKHMRKLFSAADIISFIRHDHP